MAPTNSAPTLASVLLLVTLSTLSANGAAPRNAAARTGGRTPAMLPAADLEQLTAGVGVLKDKDTTPSLILLLNPQATAINRG